MKQKMLHYKIKLYANSMQALKNKGQRKSIDLLLFYKDLSFY